MSEVVRVGGAEVEVTPLVELGIGHRVAAIVYLGRAQLALKRNDSAAASDALARVVEMCTEDGITARGIQRADAETIAGISSVALRGLERGGGL